MLGAIIGDIVGSVYEFNNTKRTDFPLFSEESNFTDDTVMSIAIADWLMEYLNDEWYRPHPEYYLVNYAEEYPCPKGGYGGKFYKWLFDPIQLFPDGERHPYKSWGNGSAMRVSAVGWLCNTFDEVEKCAEVSAAVTHNHPEGIKGAQATAVAIFMARLGKSKDEIRTLIEKRYGYNLHRTCDEIRPTYRFDESCQGTVPEAIIAFLESHDFESAIRLAVSLGGDSDTLACITGGIAEAYYKHIPEWIKSEAYRRLPTNFRTIVENVHSRAERMMKAEDSRHTSLFDFDAEAYKAYEDALETQLYFSFGGKTGTLRGRVAPDKISRLPKGSIFVFGSNALGHHAGGAAHAAMKNFGAVWGQGDGLQGQSYAISTMEGLVNTARNIDRFVSFAAEHPELKFFVTAIGCGIAGYTPLQIAPLFHKALLLPNVFLPRIFWEYFWMIEGCGPDYFVPSDMWHKWERDAKRL